MYTCSTIWCVSQLIPLPKYLVDERSRITFVCWTSPICYSLCHPPSTIMGNCLQGCCCCLSPRNFYPLFVWFVLVFPCLIHHTIKLVNSFLISYWNMLLFSFQGLTSSTDGVSLLRGNETPPPMLESQSSSDLQLHTSSSSGMSSLGPPPSYEVTRHPLQSKT